MERCPCISDKPSEFLTFFWFNYHTQSDGSEGENTPNAIIDVLKNGWGKTASYCTHTKPFMCVDTENGTIVLTTNLIMNINARMAGVTNIAMNPVTCILTINKDKKIARWEGISNNKNEDVLKALTNLGIDFPKVEGDQMLITREEGEAFAAKYLEAISIGFLDNSHAEKCHDFVADNVSWDWSDGTKVCVASSHFEFQFLPSLTKIE